MVSEIQSILGLWRRRRDWPELRAYSEPFLIPCRACERVPLRRRLSASCWRWRGTCTSSPDVPGCLSSNALPPIVWQSFLDRRTGALSCLVWTQRLHCLDDEVELLRVLSFWLQRTSGLLDHSSVHLRARVCIWGIVLETVMLQH